MGTKFPSERGAIYKGKTNPGSYCESARYNFWNGTKPPILLKMNGISQNSNKPKRPFVLKSLAGAWVCFDAVPS